MNVTTVQFSNREALAKAFERVACDARVELCTADPRDCYYAPRLQPR
jgi:hypothetical protein